MILILNKEKLQLYANKIKNEEVGVTVVNMDVW